MAPRKGRQTSRTTPTKTPFAAAAGHSPSRSTTIFSGNATTNAASASTPSNPRTSCQMKLVFETLTELHKCGMRKINFSGGEPLLQPKRLAEMIRFCKQDLGIAVSIVTNGSLLKPQWLEANARFIDDIALSCDSYDENTSIEIGRTDGKQRGDHVTNVRAAAALIHQHGIRLRVNSVINKKTLGHDFHAFITKQLAPVHRWKVFQMLLVEGENIGNGQANGRDASDLVITDAEFSDFVDFGGTIGIARPFMTLKTCAKCKLTTTHMVKQ